MRGTKIQSIVPDLRISPENEGNMVHEIKIISRYAPETGKKKDTYFFMVCKNVTRLR